ncbi:hypothetical protein M430DRAFT_69814 [Amorphotheca resinae ATCC 22711]|uniref:Uncharacterized protein n=1 Tax=Amorphotheca resinae ATCC 22711 TaxID=857342 RepID=A0A2T3AQK1_AMORE|nr:hypothetical protein M430DRAFT_69814 [Amorphotheca resinae ATCC 22711]PSS08545.1 hypothetical protein M430DRAFT_69814 [Amorphotheca resinae ATCC 22711]
MAGFTDTLRGDGLARVQRALAGLEGDPQRLDRARIRFNNSPPPYTSDRSGTTTRSQSPNPPSEEQRRREERRIQLGREADASQPHEQFSAQVDEERTRIWNADPRTSWRSMPPGDTLIKEASEIVKKRWVEQGIWNSKWNQFAYGRWKHEEPLELESETETDSEAGPSPPLFSFFPKPQRQPKSDDENRRIVERRVIRKREPPAIRIFGSSSPVQSNHRQVSGASNSSQQGPPVDIDSAGSENGDAERSSSTLNSPPPSSGKRFLHPTMGQALLPSKRKASYKDGQPANASLGPVHSSKVSKAAGKRKGPQRRLNISQKVSSDGLPLSSGVDAAEPQPSPSPDRIAPRRSKRIQPASSTNPSKRAVRSNPERNVASSLTARSSAKP